MRTTATSTRSIETGHGRLVFPCFMPVTTFGGAFPLDVVARPYLSRFAPALMASHYYAQSMKKPERPNHPLFVDSGGFASLFEGSSVEEHGDMACICTKYGKPLHPAEVLTFQQEYADIGATLDFLIPPGTDEQEAKHKQGLTIKNALWAAGHHVVESSMRLFASLQAWNAESAKQITEKLAALNFDGFALGGMVPRVRTPKVIFEIIGAIREIETDRPLHVFGIGNPKLIRALFEQGVDSVDSSSFLQNAVNKRYLDPHRGEFVPLDEVGSAIKACPCRVCQTLDVEYLRLEGALNNLALALHNLAALHSYCGLERTE
ncbi:MAG: hypothetical protein C5B50_17645 [Verrucomicrobia bacterium]|nr:MAG: hypothetical protein C5B50_17645 [Verrucomicrobiota bacterium]